jgi:Secretion system C-terminal sorting domain
MQKKIFLLVFLLAQIGVAVAQITLEHTYDEQFMLRRKLPVSGEFYCAYAESTAPTFNIYGANHAPLRQIPFVGNPLRRRSIVDVTETPNGSLRFITYVYSPVAHGLESIEVSDEQGNMILSQPRYPSADSIASIDFVKTTGLTDIIKVNTMNLSSLKTSFKIYDLNGQNLKKVANNAHFSTLKRINLELSGEKFYATNDVDSIFFFNANLTLWKKMKMPSYRILNISETLLNTDSLLEVVCQKDYPHDPSMPIEGNDSVKVFIINELESVIATTTFVEDLLFSNFDKEQFIAINRKSERSIYSFRNGINFKKKFPSGGVTWKQFGRFGKKYILYAPKNNLNSNADTIRLYNEDYTIWRIIVLPFSPNFTGTVSWNLFVTDNRRTNTSVLNCVFIEGSFRNLIQYNLKVVNENQDELLNLDNVGKFSLSEFDGVPKIYNIPNSIITAIPTLSEKLNAQVFPNPFDKTLTIKLQATDLPASQKLNIQVIDLAGKVLLTKETVVAEEIALPEAADLPSGLYFLKIKDGDNRQVVLKIVKN